MHFFIFRDDNAPGHLLKAIIFYTHAIFSKTQRTENGSLSLPFNIDFA